jgi:uncharacterized protein YozE (UPF0346 family)
MYQHDEYLKKG